MLGKIWGIIAAVSFVFGVFNGRLAEMSEAVMAGASNAVDLTLSLVGTMCLWMGVMRVAEAVGVTERIASLMRPLFRFLFPDAHQKKNGIGEIGASITANILGIGNAATPLAIKAMEKLQENNGKKTIASDDMVMFTVLGCGSLNIFPTTLIALRQGAGSVGVFDVVFPIWICSFFTAVVGVLAVKIICSFKGKKKYKQDG